MFCSRCRRRCTALREVKRRCLTSEKEKDAGKPSEKEKDAGKENAEAVSVCFVVCPVLVGKDLIR